MKYWLLYGIVMLFLNGLNSQNNFYSIDRHVDSIGYNFDNIEELTKKVTISSSSELEKTRAIFYWIAKNIKYDFIGLKSGYWNRIPFNKEMAKIVLEKRKGTCSGYSLLFKLMLDEIGIENEIILGNAKSEEGIVVNSFSNHAWNCVKIKNQWKLMDVTWASPKKESDKIKNFYFMTRPDQFIGTHYPDDTKWTLLNRDISKEDYENLPTTGASFFELGLGDEIPIIHKTKDQVKFKVKTQKNVILGFTVIKKGSYENRIIEHKEREADGITYIEINLDNPNDYKIEMTAITGDPMIKLGEVLIIK